MIKLKYMYLYSIVSYSNA